MRMVQAGVVVIDYATVAIEMLKDNASPKAGALYGALDMPFAAGWAIGRSIRQISPRLKGPTASRGHLASSV